jgi:ubiquinone/menaquinone biosynthesis C-methylase UbiE
MNKTHWQKIYQTKPPEEVSWFAPHLSLSMALIRKSGIQKTGAIMDAGGGASTLAEDLLAEGFLNISVLDISAEALEEARKRLGLNASKIRWIVSDVTQAELPQKHYELWHDRAVFHFLTQAEDRRRYQRVLKNSLKPGGYVVMAVFSPAGPEKCSGLEVVRYSAEDLVKEFGADFKLIESAEETHKTPFGTLQGFTFCLFQLAGAR